MARNFSELRARMSPESRERSRQKARQMIAEMALDELREARKLTQEQLAAFFHVGQPAISKLEKRTDMYLSTLRGIIKAMGGELEIKAVFPDGAVRINQFEEIEQPKTRRRGEAVAALAES